MEITKTLELVYTTDTNKTSTVSSDQPKEPVDVEGAKL